MKKTVGTTEKQCAKCGACTAVCPVYQVTGRESLTARGRLHLLAKLTAPDTSKQFSDILSKCLLCRACQNACPRDLDIPSMIIAARAETSQITGVGSVKKLLARHVLAKPPLLNFLSKAAGPFNLIPGVPKESGLHVKFQDNNFFSDNNTSKTNLSKHQPFPSPQKPQILYFSGCLAKYMQPAIANAASLLLEKLCQRTLINPSNQSCCGMAGLAAGDKKQATELAKKNIRLFSQLANKNLPIFTSCATCFTQLRTYPELFPSNSEWQERAISFAGRVHEFSSFLLKNIQPNTSFRDDLDAVNVLYHDPCHLRFTHKSALIQTTPTTRPPRELLKLLPNVTISELPHGPQCCGQGGLFSIAHPDLSQKISSMTTDLSTSGAQIVLTSCTGCLSQWHKSLTAAGSNVRAMHLAIFLAHRLAK